jgi:hypothetical protein
VVIVVVVAVVGSDEDGDDMRTQELFADPIQCKGD